MDSLSEVLLIEEELLPLLQETFARGQAVRYLPFRGRSMLPMLRQGKDSVELSPLPEKLCKYDLPVYRYPNGKIVMHRIVGIKDNCYLCMGDNTYRYEKITREQMIGVVSAFKRGEKRVSVQSAQYRLYCRLWVALYPVRRVLKGCKNRLRRLIK